MVCRSGWAPRAAPAPAAQPPPVGQGRKRLPSRAACRDCLAAPGLDAPPWKASIIMPELSLRTSGAIFQAEACDKAFDELWVSCGFENSNNCHGFRLLVHSRRCDVKYKKRKTHSTGGARALPDRYESQVRVSRKVLSGHDEFIVLPPMGKHIRTACTGVLVHGRAIAAQGSNRLDATRAGIKRRFG